MRRTVALILWSIAAALLFVGPALAEGMQTTTLPNGIRTVVYELHRAPVAAIQIWVRAGSRLETGKERGVTHFIEHMLFKGTPSRGPGRVAGDIESLGGQINAYTTVDHTVYHCVLPADKWRTGLDVWADALRNSLFDPTEIKREREVVLEEWRRSQDNPMRKLMRSVFETALPESPYRFPVLGFENTIKGFSHDMIKNYMAKWYTGANIAVVVTGPMPAGEVTKAIEQDFGSFPARSGATFAEPPAPEPNGPRLKSFNGRVKQAYLALAFRIPGLPNMDVVGYDMLSELIGGSDASPLTADVWGKRGLVNSIHSASYTPLDKGLFWVSASVDPAKLDQAAQAIWTELVKAGQKEFGAKELARAKLNFQASFIRSKETMQGLADQIGWFELLFGSTDMEKKYLNRVEQIDPGLIRKLAAKTFTPANLSAVVMLPEGAKVPDRAWLDKVMAAAPAAAGKPIKATKTDSGRVDQYDLPHGIKLLVQEDHSLPLFSVRAMMMGGQRLEPADQAGAFKLMAASWMRGAAGLGPDELAARIESMAGSVSAEAGRNTLSLAGSFLSRFFDPALELYCRILLDPTFAPDEVAKRKVDQLAAIKAQAERPTSVAFDLYRKTMYQGYPYGRDQLGTPETLARIDSAALKALHDKFVQPGNLVLAVVGDVDGPTVRDRLTKLLAPLGRAVWSEPSPAPPASLPEGGQTAADPGPGKAQVHTLLGFRAPGLGSPESYALDLMAAALSSQSGRMFIEMRDKKSLAYSLAAFYSPGLDVGTFAFYVGSAPEKRDQVREELKKQLAQLVSRPLSQDEFNRAKAQLIADWTINRQSQSSRAMDLALYQRYGLGLDYPAKYKAELDKLTPEKALAAFKKAIDLTRPVWVIVGPEPKQPPKKS